MTQTDSSRLRKVKVKMMAPSDADTTFPVRILCNECDSPLMILNRGTDRYFFCGRCVRVTSKVDDNSFEVSP